MKRLVFSMLAMVAMVSCTSESDPIDNDGNNGEKVEVKMTAGLLQSKAAIESNAVGNPTTDLNIFFIRATDGTTASWGELSTAITAKIEKDQSNITEITPVQFYNTDLEKNTFLIGYYPAATIAANKLSWTITGKEDIIVTSTASGNKAKKDALAFEFAHKLTQIQFKVQAEKNNTNAGSLTSIEIVGAKTNATFVPSTGTFAFESSPTTDLSTENLASSAIPVLTGVEPETISPISGGSVMLEAGSADTSYSIKLTTSTGVYNGTISIGALAGSAYEVTLTVKQQSISATATITEWKVVTGGTGEVI